MHASASAAQRGILEPIIFSKAVDYRRDVKRGIIHSEARIDELLKAHKYQLHQQRSQVPAT
jgi:hypothetical protein